MLISLLQHASTDKQLILFIQQKPPYSVALSGGFYYSINLFLDTKQVQSLFDQFFLIFIHILITPKKAAFILVLSWYIYSLHGTQRFFCM